MALQEEDLSSLGDLSTAECPAYLKWGACSDWLKVPSQQPYFIGKITKVNRRHRSQERMLILTRTTVASCRMNGKVTRAFPVKDVAQVWVQDVASSKTDMKQVVLKVPKQYDLHFFCEEQQDQLLIVLSALMMESTGTVANVTNVMSPHEIGKGEYIVLNAKPPTWKKGQHLVYVGTEDEAPPPAESGEVELVEVSDSDEGDSPTRSASTERSTHRESLKSSFGAPSSSAVGSQAVMPAIHHINL